MTCSVENLASSEDHDVQSQSSQHGLAALRPVGSSAEGGAEQAFEHAVGSFDLPALAIA